MSTPPPLSSSTVSNNDNNNCQSIMDRREECYRKNDLGEYHRDHENEKKSKYSKCWIPLLRAKRCLAFQHCAREAVEYYQTPSDKIVEGVNGPKDKGYCASYDESYCFGNPRVMKIDLEHGGGSKKTQKIRQEVFDHHERWKRRVTNSRLKQSRCEDMRKRLNSCVREHL